jgi:hypothetical protein
MKTHLAMVLLGFALSGQSSLAQTAPEQKVIRVPDGGTSGRMESIFIPPKAGAPFSFMLATEWSRYMGNGGTFTLANERHIVRDSKGRIYQERWILVPKGGKMKSWMDIFQITDPEQHTWLNCITATKECHLMAYDLKTTDNFQPPIGTTGALTDGTGFRQHEDLGLSSTEGQETHGYRESITYNPGVMGNDKPMVVAREFWWSVRLGVNLVSIVDNPMSGKQVFTAKDISIAEPDAALFEVPEGYKVVDRRNDPN